VAGKSIIDRFNELTVEERTDPVEDWAPLPETDEEFIRRVVSRWNFPMGVPQWQAFELSSDELSMQSESSLDEMRANVCVRYFFAWCAKPTHPWVRKRNLNVTGLAGAWAQHQLPRGSKKDHKSFTARNAKRWYRILNGGSRPGNDLLDDIASFSGMPEWMLPAYSADLNRIVDKYRDILVDRHLMIDMDEGYGGEGEEWGEQVLPGKDLFGRLFCGGEVYLPVFLLDLLALSKYLSGTDGDRNAPDAAKLRLKRMTEVMPAIELMEAALSVTLSFYSRNVSGTLWHQEGGWNRHGGRNPCPHSKVFHDTYCWQCAIENTLAEPPGWILLAMVARVWCRLLRAEIRTEILHMQSGCTDLEILDNWAVMHMLFHKPGKWVMRLPNAYLRLHEFRDPPEPCAMDGHWPAWLFDSARLIRKRLDITLGQMGLATLPDLIRIELDGMGQTHGAVFGAWCEIQDCTVSREADPLCKRVIKNVDVAADDNLAEDKSKCTDGLKLKNLLRSPVRENRGLQ